MFANIEQQFGLVVAQHPFYYFLTPACKIIFFYFIGLFLKLCLLLFGQILGLESLLGSEDLWPVLLGLTVVPTVLQMGLLPFCPESPRFLYIIRCQEHQAKRGEAEVIPRLWF